MIWNSRCHLHTMIRNHAHSIKNEVALAFNIRLLGHSGDLRCPSLVGAPLQVGTSIKVIKIHLWRHSIVETVHYFQEWPVKCTLFLCRKHDVHFLLSVVTIVCECNFLKLSRQNVFLKCTYARKWTFDLHAIGDITRVVLFCCCCCYFLEYYCLFRNAKEKCILKCRLLKVSATNNCL